MSRAGKGTKQKEVAEGQRARGAWGQQGGPIEVRPKYYTVDGGAKEEDNSLGDRSPKGGTKCHAHTAHMKHTQGLTMPDEDTHFCCLGHSVILIPRRKWATTGASLSAQINFSRSPVVTGAMQTCATEQGPARGKGGVDMGGWVLRRDGGASTGIPLGGSVWVLGIEVVHCPAQPETLHPHSLFTAPLYAPFYCVPPFTLMSLTSLIAVPFF